VELRHLRAFVEVSDQGHFGRAAAELRITQPALTQRIQALEREVGSPLLTRSSREVRLTATGQALLPYARSLVQLEERALREIKDTSAGTSGLIRVAYMPGNAITQGKVIAEFRKQFPSVVVESSLGHSHVNIGRLAAGEVDAAFVALPITAPETVALRRIGPYELFLALSAGHELARLDRVPVSALRGERFVLTPMRLNPAMMGALRAWLTSRTGAKLNVVAEDPQDLAVQAVGNSKETFALVSDGATQQSRLSNVTYRPLKPAPLVELALAYLRDDPSLTVANLLMVADEVADSIRLELPEDSEAISPS
jgi:DNA-binding transcriptional LysR family regulator